MAKHLTAKQHVLLADPEARLDFYESLRGSGRPCWFIRHGFQGLPYTDLCATPRAAWAAAFDGLIASFRSAESAIRPSRKAAA